VVLSPFAGIGSEGVGSLRHGRKFVGVELKESYFKHAVNNLRHQTRLNKQSKSRSLLDLAEEQA